eukprot:TRINITY_DN34960_c0_g1_i1.p1 TRINITY_DN34960_c0_g1~~TRINITY_DN34960_c0_g1_i1.p1  ORF type:complete len:398 (+),score=49.96 TRINITY_DN34960_c0_g1_i1:38-1231(+)
MLRRCRPLFAVLERDVLGSAFDFDFYDVTIEKYARQTPRSIPLHDMIKWYDSGTITEENVIESAKAMHRELPLRLARTIMSFENLPLIVLNQPGMLLVFKEYRISFDVLAPAKTPETLQDAFEYTTVVESLLKKNATLLTSLSEGVANAKRHMTQEEVQRLDEFIHLFIGHRISRRLIGANHQALTDHFKTGFSPHDVGVFHRAAPIRFILDAAAEEAQELCSAEYGQFPEIDIVDPRNAELFCVPANLQAILVELLKNSMKATVERHSLSPLLPPIEATISSSPEGTVLIELSDQGGGMSSASEASLWRYGVSGTTLLDKHGRRKTKPSAATTPVLGIRDVVSAQRLSGYGFGLPLSKARANYFGGELWVQNMEGHGIDTYIKMIPAVARWAGTRW